MLLQNLRARIGARLSGNSEGGFTLIELLVVMLILGILAAIALPAFFNQKAKANDAKAKETAHSAQVAIETFATENNGSYAGADATALHAIEPTLPSGPPLVVSGTSATGYTVTVTATGSENTFSIVNAAGTMTYPCTIPAGSTNRGGCPTGAAGWANG